MGRMNWRFSYRKLPTDYRNFRMDIIELEPLLEKFEEENTDVYSDTQETFSNENGNILK